MKKIILATTGALVAVGLGSIICNADVTGDVYTKNFQNGTRFEVGTKNGKWEGTGKIYSGSQVMYEIPFKNNQFDGELIAYGNQTGIILRGDAFSVETSGAQINGKIVCNAEEFLEKANTSNQMPNNLEGAMPCLSFEKVRSLAGAPVSIAFDGGFNYPKFTKTSTFEIVDVNNILDTSFQKAVRNGDIPAELADSIRKLGLNRLVLTVDGNNKDAALQLYGINTKPVVDIKLDLYDIPALLTGVKMQILTGNDRALFNVVKNIALTKWEVNSTGKDPDFIFNGRYTPFLLDVETGSVMQMYNIKGENILEMVALDKGFTWDAKYPVSAKKLFKSNIAFDAAPLTKMKEAAKSSKTFSEFEERMQEIPSSDMNVQVDVKNAELFDIDGTSLMNIKDMQIDVQRQSLHGLITLFAGQSNEQVVSITDPKAPVLLKMKNGGSQVLNFDEVPDYLASQLQGPALEKVWNPLSAEAIQFITESPAVLVSPLGVFTIGGLAGYTMAMNRYRANELLDYAMLCTVSAQTYGDGSKIITGDCSQPEFAGYASVPYKVEILPSSTSEKMVVRIYSVPKGVCTALESRVGGSNSVTAQTGGCHYQSNDITLTIQY